MEERGGGGNGRARWRRASVSETGARSGDPNGGRQRWHVGCGGGSRPAGLAWPNMNSITFYLFKELFKWFWMDSIRR
jgi:hypothetical protein